MTKRQAQLIIEAHEIEQLLGDEEEVKLLYDQNPEMLDAYRALVYFANK